MQSRPFGASRRLVFTTEVFLPANNVGAMTRPIFCRTRDHAHSPASATTEWP
jgi:hypothetical protein